MKLQKFIVQNVKNIYIRQIKNFIIFRKYGKND